MSKPIIGDFRSPAGNAPRAAPAPTLDPAVPSKPEHGTIANPAAYESAKANGVITELSAAPAPGAFETTATPEKELTPAEAYQKRLQEAGIDLYQARSIIDAIIVNGFHEESFTLAGRKGTFRTRSYADQMRVSKQLELENPATGYAQSDLIVRYNLAASLVEWAGHKYASNLFEERLLALTGFSGPLVNLLSRELSKFDAKMMLIFSDGAIDSF